MQMNLLRKVSLLEFRVASSSDAVKPTPSARIGFGRAGAAGHRRTTRLESSVRNLGGLAIAKAKRGVGWEPEGSDLIATVNYHSRHLIS